MRKNTSLVFDHNILEEALRELGYRVPYSSSKRVEGIKDSHCLEFFIQKTGTRIVCDYGKLSRITREEFERETKNLRAIYSKIRETREEEWKEFRKEEKMWKI